MATLPTASRLCLARTAAAKPAAAAATRALSATALRRDGGGGSAAAYSSPFRGGESKGNQIPDFGKYMAKGGEGSQKLFSYFMVGTMGAISAAAAKSTVQGMLWSPGTPFLSRALSRAGLEGGGEVVSRLGHGCGCRRAADACGSQSSSSTCRRLPTSWPWPRSRWI